MGLNWVTAKSPTITSTAKSEPAIGALKVAAMPAAAPQPTIVRSCRAGTPSIWPMAEPIAEPICTIGPSRPDRAARTDRDRRGQGLHRHDARAHDAAAHRHRFHHFGHAVALGFAREEVDERAHDQAAGGRDEEQQPRRERLRHFARVTGLGQESFLEDLGHALGPTEEEALEEPDQQAEHHRAERTGQATADPHQHHEERPAVAAGDPGECGVVGHGAAIVTDCRRVHPTPEGRPLPCADARAPRSPPLAPCSQRIRCRLPRLHGHPRLGRGPQGSGRHPSLLRPRIPALG